MLGKKHSEKTKKRFSEVRSNPEYLKKYMAHPNRFFFPKGHTINAGIKQTQEIIDNRRMKSIGLTCGNRKPIICHESKIIYSSIQTFIDVENVKSADKVRKSFSKDGLFIINGLTYMYEKVP